jgi:CheY-like chemotaxis protein
MGRARVLIIDDEPSVLELLGAAFEKRDWDLDPVGSGEAALDSFRAQRPDVLLVDKNLPGMSGVDVIREVRKLDGDIGILLMTGYASAESAQETLNLGIDEYVQKPFEDILLLAGLIERVIARARQRRSAERTVQSRKLRVLVAGADDDRLSKIVESLPRGDLVTTAKSPDDLIADLAIDHADLAILDGTSFRTEVTELARALRQKFPEVAVVVLSKRLTLTDIQLLIQLQVRGLVDHPLDSPAFAKTLGDLVEWVRRPRR